MTTNDEWELAFKKTAAYMLDISVEELDNRDKRLQLLDRMAGFLGDLFQDNGDWPEFDALLTEYRQLTGKE